MTDPNDIHLKMDSFYTKLTYMQFEYDEAKSATNKEKHGICFEDAQALWDDPWLLDVPANTTDEPRFLSIGKLDGSYWTAVWTPRGEQIRIISVRRARKREIEYYEGN